MNDVILHPESSPAYLYSVAEGITPPYTVHLPLTTNSGLTDSYVSPVVQSVSSPQRPVMSVLSPHFPIASVISTAPTGASLTDCVHRYSSPHMRSVPGSALSIQGYHNLEPQQQVDLTTRAIRDLLMLNRSPTQDLSTFEGDPLLYSSWRSAFSLLIELQATPSNEKLLHLQKYLKGQAKEAVDGFFLLRDHKAYDQAMSVLEQGFRNSYAISQAFRTKLEMWPSIRSKDSTGLRCFVDSLQQCSVAAKKVGGLSILDDAHIFSRKLSTSYPIG
ncbi:myosin, heavy polypeptide 11, smooth muscle [Elysia marginata]|uniref:Myosin, heavy polypeptide 11, smooth muscle n=1 Tax=Elysia marginata TaxID=1093978 RepID=A0AAV4IQ58_9GAST|nr:myosin, heavy polypeptide 11, smooth muscle [Elysia marginata]